jgi:hypothetical protein
VPQNEVRTTATQKIVQLVAGELQELLDTVGETGILRELFSGIFP